MIKFNFDLLTLLPRVFSAGRAIVACIQGGATREEIDAAITELHGLLESIPALQGFMSIFEVVIDIVRKILPELLGNTNYAAQLGISPEELAKAQNAVTLYQAVMTKAVTEGATFAEMVKVEDVDRMV